MIRIQHDEMNPPPSSRESIRRIPMVPRGCGRLAVRRVNVVLMMMMMMMMMVNTSGIDFYLGTPESKARRKRSKSTL